jgi:putative hydrolase of HD superfamily
MMNELQKQMSFLIEIDKLKSIERKAKLIHGSRLENDAEHSWHLAMMALILHREANTEVDLLKVIKMLLVHDIVEIDAGDTFAYDTQGLKDKYDREVKAAKRIFGLLPEDQGSELMELWNEFEGKETNEAKFATALDRLQPLIHNYMNQGDTWQKYGITSNQVLNKNKGITEGSEALWEYALNIINESVNKGILSK